MAAFKFRLELLRVMEQQKLDLRYSEDQPRWPAGTSQGGQWRPTEMGRPFGGKKPPPPPKPAAKPAASTPQRSFSLPDKADEIVTPHTRSRHSEVSREDQAKRIRDSQSNGGVYGITRNGSFGSHEEALQLTRQALIAKKTAVENVANGRSPGGAIFYRVGSPTGREAYVTEQRIIDFRPTYGVTVHIRRDESSPNGYSIEKSYPSNAN